MGYALFGEGERERESQSACVCSKVLVALWGGFSLHVQPLLHRPCAFEEAMSMSACNDLLLVWPAFQRYASNEAELWRLFSKASSMDQEKKGL